MPIHYLDLQPQIKRYAQAVNNWEISLQIHLQMAVEILKKYSHSIEVLDDRIRKVEALQGKGLRYALPGTEAIDSVCPLKKVDLPYTLLAADGSQINPDPHAAVLFALVNVGIFHLDPVQGQPAREIVQSILLEFDEVNSTDNILDEDILALKRNLAERQLLAKAAMQIQGNVVALTDGPLELYHEPQQSRNFLKQFDLYLSSLRALGEHGIVAAGYVDKPRADLVVRMLELTLLSDISKASQERPLVGLTDARLFNHLLEPGARSAIFGMQSSSAHYYSGPLSLHFFYLNVGNDTHPWIARVEIPAWVAQDSAQIDLLHNLLIDQCRIMVSKPYPYALHRAHEIAVVTLQEKQQLENRLTKEMLNRGMALGLQSHKLAAKQLPRRTR
jgi:hypothetical protein